MANIAFPALLSAFKDAITRHGVPQQPLEVYTSNSYRRVGLKGPYTPICYAYKQRADGHLDIAGTETLEAMVAAYNLVLALQQAGKLDALAATEVAGND